MAHPTKRSRQQRRKKHYKAQSKTGSKIHSAHSKPAQNEHPPPRQQTQRAQEPRPARAETVQSTDTNPSPAQVAQSVCAVDHRYIPDDFWHPWLEARLNDQIDPREVSMLIQLNDYLFSREHQTHGFDQPMSVAERSLIIFGNEKLLKASFNAPVLKSATFTLSDIGCVKNEHPLTYRHQPKAHGKPILLVENLVSYNHAVEDNKRDPRYSAVVYSEGCALQSRVDQVVELMDILESKCCEIFFDMDTAGFKQAQQVRNAVLAHPDRPANTVIRLSKRHYRALMKSPAVAHEQHSNDEALHKVCDPSWVPTDIWDAMDALAQMGKKLPQEAISFVEGWAPDRSRDKARLIKYQQRCEAKLQFAEGLQKAPNEYSR